MFSPRIKKIVLIQSHLQKHLCTCGPKIEISAEKLQIGGVKVIKRENLFFFPLQIYRLCGGYQAEAYASIAPFSKLGYNTRDKVPGSKGVTLL